MKIHNNNAYPDIMVFDDICDENLLDIAYSKIIESGQAVFPFYKKNEHSDSNPLFQEIKKLVRHVWIDKLSYLLPETFAGWEVWCNRMPEGGDLNVHIDCDERSEEWVMPYWGCVIYAGPRDLIKATKGGELSYNLDLKEEFLNSESYTNIESMKINEISFPSKPNNFSRYLNNNTLFFSNFKIFIHINHVFLSNL